MASKLMYSLCAVSVQMLCCPLFYKVAFPSHAVFIVTRKIRVTIKCYVPSVSRLTRRMTKRVGVSIMCVLCMGKLRHREIKLVSQGSALRNQ